MRRSGVWIPTHTEREMAAVEYMIEEWANDDSVMGSVTIEADSKDAALTLYRSMCVQQGVQPAPRYAVIAVLTG